MSGRVKRGATEMSKQDKQKVGDEHNKKKLLIVDDEEGITEELVDFFKDEGFHVFSATDGEGGLRIIREKRPDICLLDLKLPDLSGLAVLKAAKQECPTLKVIVNTGYVDQQLVDEAKALHCDIFMHKPFDLIELRDAVRRLMD